MYVMSCESQMRLFALNLEWLLDQEVSFHFKDMFVYHYEHILFSHLNSYLLNGVFLSESKINALNESKTDQLILVFVIVFFWLIFNIILRLLYILLILL